MDSVPDARVRVPVIEQGVPAGTGPAGHAAAWAFARAQRKRRPIPTIVPAISRQAGQPLPGHAHQIPHQCPVPRRLEFSYSMCWDSNTLLNIWIPLFVTRCVPIQGNLAALAHPEQQYGHGRQD